MIDPDRSPFSVPEMEEAEWQPGGRFAAAMLALLTGVVAVPIALAWWFG